MSHVAYREAWSWVLETRLSSLEVKVGYQLRWVPGGKAILSWAGIKDDVGSWRFYSSVTSHYHLQKLRQSSLTSSSNSSVMAICTLYLLERGLSWHCTALESKRRLFSYFLASPRQPILPCYKPFSNCPNQSCCNAHELFSDCYPVYSQVTSFASFLLFQIWSFCSVYVCSKLRYCCELFARSSPALLASLLRISYVVPTFAY
jgi:hypothetical protein